jgi:hypothetical protein
MKFLVKFSPFSCYFLSVRFKYSPQHPVLRHTHPITLCSSLTMNNISHQYERTGEIIVLYILIFMILDRRNGKIKHSKLNGGKHSPNLSPFNFMSVILI